jgi:hypothetical protein
MLARARRPAASLCLVVLAFDVVSCHHVVPRESEHTIRTKADSTTTAERVVGVTLNDGREVRFDPATPSTFVHDSLFSIVSGQPYGVPMSDVQRIWIEQVDPLRTTLFVIGTGAALFAVALGILLATKESCPFVYSWDGTQYVFDAEPYGGAITRGLERDDYGALEHLRPDSAGLYRLLVTNEVNETQYTNSMRLFVVDHKPGARLEMDEFGRLHDVTTTMALSSARDQDGRDLTSWLGATDNLIWEPLPAADPAGRVREDIVLTFPKPRGATQARLVTRASTGLWGSHMIRELLALRGTAVSDWYAAIDSSRTAQDSLRMWNVQQELYVLKLDVDEGGTWQPRALLPGGGPFIAETRVVPIDVRRAVGDSLRLRIRPPSGFWALNSFAVNYAEGASPVVVDTVAPLSARAYDGRDVLPDLSSSDDRYYAMPTTSDRAVVTFRAPAPRPGMERSIFLHTRGYYRLHLETRNAPALAELQRIETQPDAAARLAAERYASRRVAGASH